MAIAARYKGYRYPIEVIGHAVWLYHRFTLSLRDVEELMLARGVVVTYETIRSWCAKFGPDYAAQLRRWRPRPGDKWHLDEVFVKINGTTHYLWRAVDQHGDVLDILVQSRRNAVAAKRFFRKLLKGLRYVPRVLVTDKLASYQVAHREVLPSVTHRRSKYLNNRAPRRRHFRGAAGRRTVGSRRTPVRQRRRGAAGLGRDNRIPRPCRSAGEDPRASRRTGGDRPGAARTSRSA